MKHDCNLIISPSNIFQSRLEKIGNVDLGTYTLGIKGRHKKWSGSLAKEETLPWTCWCNKLHSTIRTVLLSEFVSRGVWLQQYLFAFLYWSGLPFPSSVNHILSELSTMTHRLGWPCMTAWFIASLSYASPFATTRQ